MNRILPRWKLGCLLLVVAGIAIPLSNTSVREAVWSALPSHLHGRVVDQHGDPVAGAELRVLHPFLFGTSSFQLTTDGEGRFSAWLWLAREADVMVSKDGHAAMKRRGAEFGSRQAFHFSGAGRGDSARVEAERPPVLHLWKQGVLEPVVIVPQQRVYLKAGGVMEAFSFHPQNPLSQHAVEVGFWIIEDKVDARGRHDWRCEVRVPHGGLVRRRDEWDFTAPEAGYTASDSGVVSPAARPEWKGTSSMRRDYFVRFDDGVFARCQVIVVSAGDGNDQYVLFESVLNPKAGSRNLEVELSAAKK